MILSCFLLVREKGYTNNLDYSYGMEGLTMKKILILNIFTLCFLLTAASSSLAQKIETKDGIRVFSKSGLLPGITGAEKSLDINGVPL